MSTILAFSPFTGQQSADIISHLNQEHQDDLMAFVCLIDHVMLKKNIGDAGLCFDIQRFISQHREAQQQKPSQSLIQQVYVIAIYPQGLQFKIQWHETILDQNPKIQQQYYFLPFFQAIAHLDQLHQQYILLVQKSSELLGRKSVRLVNQYFEVLDSIAISENMQRLVLKAPSDTPLDLAGYAYLFCVEQNEYSFIEQTKLDAKDQKNPAQHRHRYYTLRKAWQIQQQNYAWIDIYCHGHNLGGTWAKQLKPKMWIKTVREFPEKLDHLQHGQAVLIADESSLSTVARSLELWQNPILPKVILFTQHEAEQAYLKQVIAEQGQAIELYSISYQNEIEPCQKIISILAQIQHNTAIDAIWAGLENQLIKQLRQSLKQDLQFQSAQAVLKVYWRKD